MAIVGPGVFAESVSLTAPAEIIGDGASFQAIAPTSGSDAITVSAGVNDTVRISNVQILGDPGSVPVGLSVASAKNVDLDHVVFRGFSTAAISYTPSNTDHPKILVNSTAITGILANGECIFIQPSSSNAEVFIQDSNVSECGDNGIIVDVTKTPSGGYSPVTIRNSYVGRLGTTSVSVLSTAGSGSTLVILQGTAVLSDGTGVSASGPGSVVMLNGSTSEDNTTGAIATNSGVIYSYGNNDLPSGTAVTSIPLQ